MDFLDRSSVERWSAVKSRAVTPVTRVGEARSRAGHDSRDDGVHEGAARCRPRVVLVTRGGIGDAGEIGWEGRNY